MLFVMVSFIIPNITEPLKFANVDVIASLKVLTAKLIHLSLIILVVTELVTSLAVS